MLNTETIERLARRLEHAERTREPMRHFSIEHPNMTVEDGYKVQSAWIQHKLANGAAVRGHKIGLTSPVMQEGAGIHEPDYGVLLDYMIYEAGDLLPTQQFIAPRVEVELCFVLGKALKGPKCTIFDVFDATDFVTPALEVIDTRFYRFDPNTNAPRTIMDTIADNAANGAVVLGGRPIRVDEVDLRWVGALLFRNETIEESGVAAAVLNHPANAIAWLANKLAIHGDVLNARELVLAGSFTRSIPVRPGDVIHCDYGPLGTIACRFA